MLCSDGILAEYLNVDNCEDLLDDFLFCIHFQRQYSAAAEFADYESSQASRSGQLNNKTIARALQKGKDNETLLNDDYMATKCAEILTFGSIIQVCCIFFLLDFLLHFVFFCSFSTLNPRSMLQLFLAN